MGIYLNPGSDRFVEALNSDIFVDKTGLIAYLNSVIKTKRKYLSVSRPRRFGKTTAADMICAYYERGTDARNLFEGLEITRTKPVRKPRGAFITWDAYLGSFDVIRLTITEFLKASETILDMLERIKTAVVSELAAEYSHVSIEPHTELLDAMRRIYAYTSSPFVVVIDEWDAPMRERQQDAQGQKAYLDFLRDWFKDQPCIALAYMTGILPIKKYGNHSALNMFDEYSMVAPLRLASYTGFTEDEVRELCDEWGMSFSDVRAWYDGYAVIENVPHVVSEHPRRVKFERRDFSLYSPFSVVQALVNGSIQNWWNKTETYEALAKYIRMDYDGLKAAVALLMDGGRLKIDLGTYQNDMTTFHGRDDVLALLIHLGYLGWADNEGEVFIPNKEILSEFRNSTKAEEWKGPLREYEVSKELVKAT